jgi:hypothetical protein
MRQLLILLNLLYIAMVPALAIIIQGGLSHDFALSFLPDYISKYMLGFAYIYAIVMVMMLSFMVNKESDSRVFIGVLLSGPLAGLLISWLSGGQLVHGIYNMYIIEGTSFVAVLSTQMLRHFKRIQTEAPFVIKVILPVFILGCFGGFIRSINFDFFTDIYSGGLAYAGLATAAILNYIALFGTLKRFDNAYGNRSYGVNNPVPQNTQDLPSGSPFILVIIIVGLLAFGFHTTLMEEAWLTELLK